MNSDFIASVGTNMKDKFFKLLDFFRIIDDDQRLSLTHLVIFVSIYKILVAPVFTISEVTSLLVAMLAYGYKRHVNKSKAAITDENKAALQKLELKVNQLSDKQGAVATAMGFKPLVK